MPPSSSPLSTTSTHCGKPPVIELQPTGGSLVFKKTRSTNSSVRERNRLRSGEVFDLLWPITRSMLGGTPWCGRATTDEVGDPPRSEIKTLRACASRATRARRKWPSSLHRGRAQMGRPMDRQQAKENHISKKPVPDGQRISPRGFLVPACNGVHGRLIGTGCTLPWGQMSFWGATVITNLSSAVRSASPSQYSFIR